MWLEVTGLRETAPDTCVRLRPRRHRAIRKSLARRRGERQTNGVELKTRATICWGGNTPVKKSFDLTRAITHRATAGA